MYEPWIPACAQSSPVHSEVRTALCRTNWVGMCSALGDWVPTQFATAQYGNTLRLPLGIRDWVRYWAALRWTGQRTALSTTTRFGHVLHHVRILP